MAAQIFEGSQDPSERSAHQQIPNESPLRATIRLAAEATPLATQSVNSAASSLKFRHEVCDFAGTVSASVAGVAVFSLGVAARAKGAAFPLAAAAGSLTEYSVKSGLEHLLLPPEERTASEKDLVFGAFDGLAGVAGGYGEKLASEAYLRSVGKIVLGPQASRGTALLGGTDFIEDSALAAIGHTSARSSVGGLAAGALWSLPRQVEANAGLLSDHPLEFGKNVVAGTLFDTAFAGLTAGAFGLGLSSIARGSEVVNYQIAKVIGRNDRTWVDIYCVNDLHSNIDQLPKMKTLIDQLMVESRAKGRTAIFVVAGDPISGHVNFAFTEKGAVEYRALAKIGQDADATIIGLGNHEYDAPGGRFDPDRYPSVIGPILADHPNVHLINTNLDVSAINGFEELVKRSHTIPMLNSTERLGLTAVTTEEGALGSIKYNDALTEASKSIRELNDKGIKFVQLTTHIGAQEDEQLARGLLNNGQRVIMANGGHSHTVLPTLRWYSSKETLIDKLQFWKPTEWIPNMQAGHSGKWLSVSHIAIKPNGSPDRWLSSGRLIPITDKIADDQSMRKALDEQAQEILKLKEEKYGARATSTYSLRGVREGETPLGNLYADALFAGIKGRANIEPDIVLVHSGGIRAELPSGHELSRLDLANIVMNAGKLEGEQQELTVVRMTGKELKQGLEYGVKEMNSPQSQGLSQRVKALFGITAREHPWDPSGNFMDVAGMRYSFDLRNPVGNRVVSMQLKTGKTFTDIIEDKEYKVLARFHAMDKWHKNGIFGDVTQQEAYEHLRYEPVTVSQVDLLADYIKGKELNPNKIGAVKGRIKNLTPKPADLPIKLGPYQVAPGSLAIRHENSQ